MIDQREILDSLDNPSSEKYYETFSISTYNKLTEIATSFFQSLKETGYSKQLLTIGITECEILGRAKDVFFSQIQNFELTICISSLASENNAKIYLKQLKSKIREERLQYIVFSKANSFFESSPELGFNVNTMNKIVSGLFKYRLLLPKIADNQDEEFDKLKLINLKPVRLYAFPENCGDRYAYTSFTENKVLLIYAQEN